MASLGWVPCAVANPVFDHVVAGQATIHQTTNTTTINQASQRAIIDWRSFNIQHNEKTSFFQPNGGVALNRINPQAGASQIYGQLTATGQIILINPAGIHFGANAYVNVGGLIASTANITDQDFLNGIYRFSHTPGFDGAIINQGTIKAAQHGLIALVGNAVSNEGLIQVDVGHVVLASCEAFTMNFAGNDLINFSIDKKVSQGHQIKTGVVNTGSILADGGKVLITAQAAAGVLDQSINLSGIIQARSVSQHNGEIIISGDPSQGTVKINGKLDASGQHQVAGGKITVTGYNILLDTLSNLDVSGDLGGGVMNIGGNYQGNGPLSHANATVLAAGARLYADAYTQGHGGNIVLWSDQVTKAYGAISARGGSLSGNGGLVETSSHTYLDVNGLKVDLLAPKGKTGNWLLDPADLTICSACTTTNPLSGGIFAAGATNSFLLVSDLITALASANITVLTSSAGSGGNGDIFINTNINYSSPNSLTLSAYRNITGTGANSINNGDVGNVILRADNTGTGVGTVSFATGNVTTNGEVHVYYNPVVFGTQDVIYTGGLAPIQYMLINSLGSELDTTTRSLASVSNTSAWWAENFALAANIDASATSGWGGGTGFTPIGNTGVRFTGYFDGQNYTISNLFINRPFSQQQGLFGRISAARISNLSVSGNVTGRSGVALVIGQGDGISYITNVHTLAGSSVSSSSGGTGGVAGSGVLFHSNVTNMANVTSTSNADSIGVGGVQGAGGIFDNVSNQGNVTGSGGLYVGGITGFLDGGLTINNAVNSGVIISANNAAGGIVGQSGGSVTNSYNTGNVTSSGNNAGGIAGFNGQSVANSYNTGRINGSARAGGIVGLNSGGATIINTFNIGVVTGGIVGPIVSNVAAGTTIYNNIWNTETTGIASASIGTPATTAAMMSQTTYCPSGDCNGDPNYFDFANTWNIIPGQSYPYLRSFYSTTPRAFSGVSQASLNTGTLVSNGQVLGTSAVGANGGFYFLAGNNLISQQNTSVADNSNMLIYLSSGGSSLFFAAPTSNGSLNDLIMSGDAVRVGTSANANFSNSNIAAAIGGLVAPGIGLTMAGNNITLDNDRSFITTNTTTFTLNGDIETTSSGSIIFNNSLVLGANSTLQALDDLVLNGVTSGAYTLTASAGNDITANGNIGSISTPLAGLSLAASNNLNLNGNVYTTGNQTYSGATTLGNNINLNSSAGSITFNNAVNGAFNLAASGATGVNFNDNVGDVTPLNSLSITGPASLTGNTVSTIASQIYNSPLTLTNPTTLITTGNNTAITINGLIGNQNLILGGGANNNQTFTLAGDLGTSNITVNGSTGSNNLIVNTNSATQDWILNAGTSGSLPSVAGGITFSNIANVSGGNNNDNFTLAGNFTGSLSGGAGNNSLTGMNTANTWNITGANAGSVTNLGGTFANIQNLIGGSITNIFNLLGGFVSSIVGGAGNNTLVGYSGTYNTWNINGTDAGSVTGVNSFSQIQNLTGGNSGNLFAYANNAVTTGLLNGGNLASENTINYSAYTSDVSVNLAPGLFEGTAEANGGFITYFYQNINNLIANGNNNNSLTLPNKMNTLTVTGSQSGYINDPLYYSGFNMFTALGSGNLANINVPAAVNYTNNTVTINGVTMSFINFILGAPPVPPVPPTPNLLPNVSGIIQSAQDMPGQIYLFSPTMPGVILVTENVDQATMAIAEWYDSRVVRVTVGANCMGGVV